VVGLAISLVGIASIIVECEIPSILPAVTEYYSMSAAAASWLMSVFTFVGVLVALPIGRAAAIIEPRRFMTLGALVILFGSILAAFAPDSTVLLAARVVQGIALVMIAVCGPALIKSNVHPSRIGTAMGIWAVGFGVGSTLAGVTTPLLSGFIGFKAVWVLYGIFTLAMAFVARAFVSATPAFSHPGGKERGEEGEAAAAELPASGRASYREILTRDSCLFMLAYLIFNMMVFAVVSYVPTVLQLKGYEPTQAGFISTLPMLLAIISGPAMGVLYDRVASIKPPLLVCLLSFGPFVFLMFNLSGAALWVAAILFGIIGMSASGVLLPTFLSLIRRNEAIPLAMGAFTLVQGVGQFLGSFLIQALLGPELNNWLAAGVAMLISGLIATAAVALCALRR
jgi:predicted MFS family arabinose efflux permease